MIYNLQWLIVESKRNPKFNPLMCVISTDRTFTPVVFFALQDFSLSLDNKWIYV